MFEQDCPAIEFGSVPAGDGGDGGVTLFENFADASRRVCAGDALNFRMLHEKSEALRQRDGMRLDDADFFKPRARASDEVVDNRNGHFGNDVQRAFKQQIVGLMNGSSETIFERNQCEIGSVLWNCGKERFESWPRDEGNFFAEQLDHSFFAERSALTLKCDSWWVSWGRHESDSTAPSPSFA